MASDKNLMSPIRVLLMTAISAGVGLPALAQTSWPDECSREWDNLDDGDLGGVVSCTYAVDGFDGAEWTDELAHTLKTRSLDRALERQGRENAAYVRDVFAQGFDVLGWSYHQQGKHDQAADQLERAVELQPEDAQHHDRLGDVYAALGRTEDARAEWQAALPLWQQELDRVALLEKEGSLAKPTADDLRAGIAQARVATERKLAAAE